MSDDQRIDQGVKKFAVLHHTDVEEPHYDLMFETSATSELATFRLGKWPMFEGQSATKLRPHRRAYLNFVGPVSGNRGRVDRVDEGEIHLFATARGWVLKHLDGRMMVTLEPDPYDPEAPWSATVI